MFPNRSHCFQIGLHNFLKFPNGNHRQPEKKPDFKPKYLSPRYFKKAKGILLSPPSVRPSVCPSVHYAISSKTIYGARNVFFLAPSPWALGRGQKVKFHLISITKSILKKIIPNFVCVLTNERYKTYQTGYYSFTRVMP